MSEISTKPYMLRAIYEWCTDSGYTPYLAVKVDARATVPMEYVKKGEIVLNISFGATSGLKMENDAIRFHARFGGVSREIYVPVDNVMAIYANENGQGMAFEPQLAHDDPDGQPTDSPASASTPAPAGPTLSSVPTSAPESRPPSEPDSGNGNDEPPKKGGRPTLTRIK
ncbi:ClpXP protease specificity-enhancing factor [Janthinobacterium agaricidamnosum]|uniref:Stringent starvation protein B n=1 Tax=Janthinobacterium agaricidamnosum NBRC 102515 = DSM 9628 TaxID=1349767 RepID=W0VCP0_9BURK|nr:ClpXP protease specificity-enhancing factor [Janthinobacterium agaricidamnosum]CDG85681.1 stringent starvation protein B [Janthinobacterium agaricidamnosum NBRC 102515 = DSM 9628]